MNRFNRIVTFVVVLILALGINVASAAITPPVAGDQRPTNQSWRLYVLADALPVTASFNSNPALTVPNAACSLQYVSAISTTNAMTLALQGSNDNVNWVSFTTNVVSNVTTAQNDFFQYNNPVVRYTRIATTLANANVITLSYFIVCR